MLKIHSGFTCCLQQGGLKSRWLFDKWKISSSFIVHSSASNESQAAIDSLIADFNDHPDLPGAVFVVGEQYYYKAFEDPKRCVKVKSEEYLKKAKAIWEKIITELPPSPVTPEACYFAARCYERIGEYNSAIQLYEIVLHDCPDYQFAGIAQYLLACC